MYLDCGPRGHKPTFKILVIDRDEATANTIAATMARGSCEVIWCRDIALAEVAIDLTDFDLILVAPDTTGVDGMEGLAVADFLAARNPAGITTLLLQAEDGDLRAVVERRGAFRVLNKPLLGEDLLPLLSNLNEPRHRAVVA